jgi:hypothetical protein
VQQAQSEAEASRQVTEMQDALATAEAERDEAREGSAALGSEVEALRGETAELQDANQQLEASVTELRSANQQLEASVTASRDANQRLEASSTQQAQSEAKARHRIAELEDLLATAQAERDGLESEHSRRLAESATEAQSQVEDLSGRLRAAEMFLAESESRRRRLAEQLSSLRQGHEPARHLTGAQPSGAEPELESRLESSPPDDVADIMAMVDAWAEAWSTQRADDYLAFYARTYEPPADQSRAQWESLRRELVLAPERVSVGAALLDLRLVAPDRAEVEILQSYSSDRYSDMVVKTLALIMESGRWKIARESSE